MKRVKTIISITALAALMLIIYAPSITGYTVIHTDKIKEVAPALTHDEVISDGALFRIESISNPAMNKEEDLSLYVKNGIGLNDPVICITNIRVNGETVWTGTRCINEQSQGYLTVPYIPRSEGTYLILIDYEANGSRRNSLQFTLDIKPINTTSSIEAALKANGKVIGNELNITTGETVNTEVIITSKTLTTVKVIKAVLTAVIDYEQYIYEVTLNNNIPPLTTITRKETITNPLSRGSYKIKAYLYINNNGRQEVVSKEVKLNVQ